MWSGFLFLCGMPDDEPPINEPFEPKPGEPYAEGEPTANEKLLDSAIYQGLSLEGVNKDMAGKIRDIHDLTLLGID